MKKTPGSDRPGSHRQDLMLVAGLTALLIVLTFIAAAQTARPAQASRLSSLSNQPEGARALRLWLEELGFPTSDQVQQDFATPDEARVIFLLEPQWPGLLEEEWALLREAVEGGAVLVLGSSASENFTPLQSLGIASQPTSGVEVNALPAGPVLSEPALRDPLRLTPQHVFSLTEARAFPLLSGPGGVIVAQMRLGQGRVIVISDPDFLTNARLKEPQAAALVLNLLASLPPGSPVWFDEWHHGIRPLDQEAGGPENWLTRTPSGQALLLAFGLIFVSLALSGRRFGRPVPLPRQQARRTPLEFVTAIANLNRRAGHRREALQHYHSLLKRSLGKRYRLDPALPDEQWAARLARMRPPTAGKGQTPEAYEAALLDLLKRLKQSNVSEAQLVRLASEAAAWMQDPQAGPENSQEKQ